jgi:hypothetical protein
MEKMKHIKLAISLGLILINYPGFSGTMQSDSILQKQLIKARVVSVKSLNRKLANSAIIGDLISVKVKGLDSILKNNVEYPLESMPILLVLNGSPCTDIPLYSIDFQNQSLIYKLDTSSVSLKKLKVLIPTQWGKVNLSQVSIRYNKFILNSDVKYFCFYYTSPHLVYDGILIFTIIIILMIVLARATNIMRIRNEETSYSLAQAQLTFWTLVVFISVIYIWIITGNLPDLSHTTLSLLGISVATTAGCKYVDYEVNKSKPSVFLPSKGFFRDILSDNSSTSIHRLQMVVWTIFLGFVFLCKVLATRQIYVIPPPYMILLGISNGAYMLLKLSEDRGEPPINEAKQKNETASIPPMG